MLLVVVEFVVVIIIRTALCEIVTHDSEGNNEEDGRPYLYLSSSLVQKGLCAEVG